MGVLLIRLLSGAAIAAVVLFATTSRAAEPPGLKYGDWGLDLAGRDTSVKPGDDFFRYANGAWLDRNAIPADKPGVSLRLKMTDLAEARVHAILEEAARSGASPTTTEGKVGAFYTAFMDEARVEALGVRAIAPELDAVRAAKTREALAGLMGRSVRDFDGAFFGVYPDVDVKDTSRYAVYLGQGGLGLP